MRSWAARLWTGRRSTTGGSTTGDAAGSSTAARPASAGFAAAGHALLWKRDPRAALGWIVVSLTVPVVGPLFYFVFGINRIRTRAQRLPLSSSRPDGEPSAAAAGPEVPVEFSELAGIAGAVSRFPLTGGNRVEVLHNGDYRLEGTRMVNINGEQQLIEITGVCRPRDIAPDCAHVDDVYLYTIDDLDKVILEGQGNREAAAVEAQRLLDEEIRRYAAIERSKQVAPIISTPNRSSTPAS